MEMRPAALFARDTVSPMARSPKSVRLESQSLNASPRGSCPSLDRSAWLPLILVISRAESKSKHTMTSRL